MSFWALVSLAYIGRVERRAERQRREQAEVERRRERRHLRVNLFVALVSVAAVALTALWFASDVRARPDPPTQIVMFDFYSISDLQTLEPLEGVCLDFSATSNRLDAHRCFSEEYVLDPCFSSAPKATTVLCPSLLSSAGADFLLEVTSFRSLDRLLPDEGPEPPVSGLEGDVATITPWAIELEDGNRCVFTSGASWVVSDTRLNFVCDKGIALGMPETSTSTWTIIWSERYALEAHPLIRVPVRKAWL
jgi:hypothetical protein